MIDIERRIGEKEDQIHRQGILFKDAKLDVSNVPAE
jgi:hypothetical protein